MSKSKLENSTERSQRFYAECKALYESKPWRCRDYLVGHNQRLQSFIKGVINAPTDKFVESCKRKANRELRHVLKLASILRYYQNGGK